MTFTEMSLVGVYGYLALWLAACRAYKDWVHPLAPLQICLAAFWYTAYYPLLNAETKRAGRDGRKIFAVMSLVWLLLMMPVLAYFVPEWQRTLAFACCVAAYLLIFVQKSILMAVVMSMVSVYGTLSVVGQDSLGGFGQGFALSSCFTFVLLLVFRPVLRKAWDATGVGRGFEYIFNYR